MAENQNGPHLHFFLTSRSCQGNFQVFKELTAKNFKLTIGIICFLSSVMCNRGN